MQHATKLRLFLDKVQVDAVISTICLFDCHASHNKMGDHTTEQIEKSWLVATTYVHANAIGFICINEATKECVVACSSVVLVD